jgi:hypothetical protein
MRTAPHASHTCLWPQSGRAAALMAASRGAEPRQRMGLSIRGSVRTEDVGQIHLAPLRHRQGRHGTAHRSATSGIGQVQRRARRRDTPLTQVEVAHGGGDVTVPEKPLDRGEVRARLDQVRGEGWRRAWMPPCLRIPLRSFAIA